MNYRRRFFLMPCVVCFIAAGVLAMDAACASDAPSVETGKLPPYQRMEFGPALFWTLQVERGNIAYKAIAVRLDAGPGGVSKGRAWLSYDHDTLRGGGATTGNCVDWSGIASDGSHRAHTSVAGDRHGVSPPGPGWANGAGRWADPPLRGRNGLPYGPLP